MSSTRREILSAAAATSAALAAARPATARADGAPGGSLRIGGHTSSGPLNHKVNSYWIETERGVIVVDGQWTLPEARRALAELRRQTDKPIVGILLTHPHSDHYGGLGVFAAEAGPDAPIHASALTLRSLKHDEQGFFAGRKKAFGDAFPAYVTLPNSLVADGDRLDLDAVPIEVLDLRQNEALTTTLFYLPEGGPDVG